MAFTVALSKHLILLGGEDIIYNKVFTNIGSHYDIGTGKFKAPVAGTYVFQFHGLSRNNKILYLELYHNNKYVTSAFSHAKNDWASGGNDVILHLTAGDTVNIRDAAKQDSQLSGDDGEIYCTFSGYLIASYDSGTSVVG